MLYSASNESMAEMIIAVPDDHIGWKQTPLANQVGHQWPDWRIGPAAEMVFNKQGTMFVTATLSSESKSDSFSTEYLSNNLPLDRKWWSNLVRPTGHNVIAKHPSILFTSSIRGAGNNDILSNDVYWVG